jgi:hypothetical protein
MVTTKLYVLAVSTTYEAVDDVTVMPRTTPAQAKRKLKRVGHSMMTERSKSASSFPLRAFYHKMGNFRFGSLDTLYTKNTERDTYFAPSLRPIFAVPAILRLILRTTN